jgi:hypothetical protein
MYSYIFNDADTAISAEMYICDIGSVPLSGFNAESGDICEKNEYFTNSWATPKQLIDGRWAFSVVPEFIRDNYPTGVTEYFNENFPNEIDVLQPSAFVDYKEVIDV